MISSHSRLDAEGRIPALEMEKEHRGQEQQTENEKYEDILNSFVPMLPRPLPELAPSQTAATTAGETGPFHCDICNDQFADKIKHERYHEKRGCKCLHCGLWFSDRRTLGNHWRTYHKDIYDDDDNQREIEDDRRASYVPATERQTPELEMNVNGEETPSKKTRWATTVKAPERTVQTTSSSVSSAYTEATKEADLVQLTTVKGQPREMIIPIVVNELASNSYQQKRVIFLESQIRTNTKQPSQKAVLINQLQTRNVSGQGHTQMTFIDGNQDANINRLGESSFVILEEEIE